MSVFAVDLPGEYCEPPFGLVQFQIRSTGTKAIRHTDCTIPLLFITLRALAHIAKIIFWEGQEAAFIYNRWISKRVGIKAYPPYPARCASFTLILSNPDQCGGGAVAFDQRLHLQLGTAHAYFAVDQKIIGHDRYRAG